MTKSRDLANAATALNAVTAAELGYVDGVTSAIQTQLDAKLASSTAATTYVANALADAKGDIFVASADNTVTRLPVGSTGDTIVADSSTSTGLRYQAPVNDNPILNSSFQVWQRGTSFSLPASSSTYYNADRWLAFTNANQATTISRQQTSDSTNLPFIQYCARVQRNSGQTGVTGGIQLWQSLETVNSIPYTGKTITVSFYARAGANFSSAGNLLEALCYLGTGTDQNIGGYSGITLVSSSYKTLTTTWQRFTTTMTVATNSNELSFGFQYIPTGTAGANDYFEITGVQVEVGSVATPFKTYAGTIQGELAACQRYYQLVVSGNSKALANGAQYSATAFYAVYAMKVTMRTAPTLSQTTGTNYYAIEANSATDNFDAITSIATTTPDQIRIEISSGISGTAGHAGWIQTTNASAFVALVAEL